MPDPCIVTLDTPPADDGLIDDIVGTSNENASVNDPARTPTVSTTCFVPPREEDDLHTTRESDAHAVVSQADPAIRVAGLYDDEPNPDPCTVTLKDPVLAAFARPMFERVAASYDNRLSAVPTRTLDVMMTRRVPPDPLAVKAIRLESDAHSVASQAVWPILALALVSNKEKLVPLTVTLIDPVLATFARLTLDMVGIS
jgi:hypothetical protein